MNIKIFGPEGFLKKLFGKNTEETAEQLYSKAKSLFDKGNAADAYVYLQAAALKGHAEAAFQLATAISEKKTFGTMKDAVTYYTIASEKNHAFATTNLATCYQLGKGTEIDYIKAIQLLNKAIKLGDEMAAFNLAQTYLLGVGVKQDEKKGWSMLTSLADKGNKRAQDFMSNLIQKGYKAPYIEGKQPFSSRTQNSKNIHEYEIDHAPECEIEDSQITTLYNSAKQGNKTAIDELMDLGGNQMNREAMNALRKLGLIVEDVSEEFKRGTIEYIATAWKTYNVEPLYIACVWTYPGFIYREYCNDRVSFETKSENVFIERISKELSKCVKDKIAPMFRLRQVNTSSSYCVDVLIQNISLSSFYLDIEDGHFKGIYRVYDNTIA